MAKRGRSQDESPMLVKLRHKFVLITMVFAAIVLVVVTAAACYATYKQQESAVFRALDSSISLTESRNFTADGLQIWGFDGFWSSADDFAGGPRDFDGQDEALRMAGDDQIVATSTYVVSSDGSVNTRNDSLALDAETVQFSIQQAIDDAASASSSDLRGRVRSQKLYYRIVFEQQGGAIVAFASYNYVQQSISAMLRSLLVGGLLALLAFFFMSLGLSRWVVGPISQAWNQQRQFIADASHELKTPLTVILANNSILASNPESSVASQMQWVEGIEAEGHLMQDLVNDMLYLAESESVSRAVEYCEVDFSEIVMGMTLQFEAVAFEKGVFIEEQIEEGLVLHGDAARLKRLVGVLVDNACKYAESGSEVRVVLARDASKARLSVANQGALIDPEDLPHLFDRFYRSDKARSKDTGGFGLGLAIAKSVAEDMGGSIAAISNETQGTVFTAEFPLAAGK